MGPGDPNPANWMYAPGMGSYYHSNECLHSGYIPEHLIIRDVEKVFNEKDEDNDKRSDTYYKKRLEWGLNILTGYGKALKAMRDETKIHHDKFGNGM